MLLSFEVELVLFSIARQNLSPILYIYDTFAIMILLRLDGSAQPVAVAIIAALMIRAL